MGDIRSQGRGSRSGRGYAPLPNTGAVVKLGPLREPGRDGLAASASHSATVPDPAPRTEERSRRATGVANVSRGRDDAADVVWFDAQGNMRGAETHNDSAGAAASWAGYEFSKSVARQGGGLQAVTAVSLRPGDEHVFWAGPDGQVLFRAWAAVHQQGVGS